MEDFERPLNERGEKDAPRMGKQLHKQDAQPDLICSSPARRAMSTAKIISEILAYPLNSIQSARELYHAGPDEILRVVQSFRDTRTCAMIVGHNPGLTDFVNDLCDEDIMNIPTAGVVRVHLQTDSWKRVTWKGGKLMLFDYPKKNQKG